MTSIPTLALNGEAIQLKNMRVTVSQQFQDKDQSGQTSATTKSEQGAKRERAAYQWRNSF